jgi:hypothetical protein
MATTLRMGRGTTPLYTISITGVPLEDIADIYMTFEQNKSWQELTKHFPEITESSGVYSVKLTQAETLAFQKGSGKVQIRLLDVLGNAIKTEIWNMTVSDVLYEEVI